MSNQGGLKHVATEPTRLESKRERRRGAAGRAAALRRAPSDSDCSGETASLSADSGDRAIRPAPQPPPRGKSRSRRRDSEWEVLEGLKDGQRFDRRPEVFNGYLHKKRKWPLKGWHKRFFVVDGGILVYARSPTDVARGRLHGSVDVGLSVISAKARRRRIDIDADEFIYHLRAKTPDVFRTWLTVLKAHRLYRQHLLTFGARESVPKIHAPLEDLPQTDTSSRTTSSSIEITTLTSLDKIQNTTLPLTYIPSTEPTKLSSEIKSYVYGNKNQFTLNGWSCTAQSSRLLPLTFEELKEYSTKLPTKDTDRSISLINLSGDTTKSFSPSPDTSNKSPISFNTTDAEKQMHSTDLEINLKSPDLQSSVLCEYRTNTPHNKNLSKKITKELQNFSKSAVGDTVIDCKDKTISLRCKTEPILTYCFSMHKISQNVDSSPMRRSRKSTNLEKYRNISCEPPLGTPLNKLMLLGSNSNLLTKQQIKKKCHQSAHCNIVLTKHIEMQTDIENNDINMLKDTVTASDFDNITEKLMKSVFDNMENTYDHKTINVRSCINQVLKELYESKTSKSNIHPIIALFKSLLEYWLKNTSLESVRDAVRRAKSIDRQSNKYFTKDKNTSSFNIQNVNKQTQFQGTSDTVNQDISRILVDIMNKNDKSNKEHGARIIDSSEKERRIQELEIILKNTVYICETTQNKSKEKDIKITKTLIDNLEKISQKSVNKTYNDNANIDTSNSSSELPKIQDTIKHLLSETSLPLDIAKDFLGAYLDLLHSSKTSKSSSESTNNSKSNSIPNCDVQTESVQKRASKGITTREHVEGDTVKSDKKNIDSSQLYLKTVLDRITKIFCKATQQCKIENNIGEYDTKCGDSVTYNNSLEIDLTNYSLEHISMNSNPKVKGITSVTMKIREKQAVTQEIKSSLLYFMFSDTNSIKLQNLKPVSSNNFHCKYIAEKPISAKTKLSTAYDLNAFKEFDLKPYATSSDTTSKEYGLVNSDPSINLHSQHDNLRNPDSVKSLHGDNDTCYILSSFKCPFHVQVKKNIPSCDTADSMGLTTTPITTRDFSEEISMFEKTPQIIDEKFILLLLENLTMLSKNIPALHRDINVLYIRLRKKYEKVIKNQSSNFNNQGVGLLGKIYVDEINSKFVEHKETQFDKSIFCNEQKEIATKTSAMSLSKLDKSLTALIIEGQTSMYIQTEECNCDCLKPCKIGYLYSDTLHDVFNTSTTQTPTFSSKSEKEGDTKLEKAVSNQNWYRKICTKDCAISTLTQYALDESKTSRNFRIEPKYANKQLQLKMKDIDNKTKNLKLDRGHSNKIRQDLIKEIKLLSPSFKVSTQSQTDRLIQRNSRVDFIVYELFSREKYNPKKSCSMIDLNCAVREKSDDLKTIYRCTSYPSYNSGLVSPSGAVRTQAGFVSGTPGGRLASWIIESGGPLESASRELGQAQLSVQQLQRLLDALELHQQTHHDTDVSLEGASPNVKKDRRKFGLRKKKSNSKCASVELQPPHFDPSASHMALSTLTAPPSPGGASSVPNSAASLPIGRTVSRRFQHRRLALKSYTDACAATRPQSLPGAEALNAAGPTSISSLTLDHQLREDFTVLAKDLVGSLKSVVATLVCERGRLRAAMDAADASATPGSSMVAALRTNLSTALHQNSELRARLARIHDASDINDLSSINRNSEPNRQFQQSLSYSSSCVSASEFFDAEEHEDDDLKPAEIIDADEAGVIELDGDSSSEAGSLSSEEGSASSDNSDAASIAVVPVESNPCPLAGGWTRRTELPAPRPTPGGPSLWNLLYKNIGKDLSQISMPVTINEPLNMLQRLCEELEYSELLDAAAACRSSVERMALVGAFAVSAYAAAAHRAASKPFNPLLHETYECVREDRGFRFIAEQVSHHPPISACHAESPRWCFWQEARIKTKFWGKSMEFQPAGRVHVRLLTTGDHYSWNKVTTCVHNLFGGQRWVDQYGDMQITCHGTDITCKLNFIKASSWSSSRHEVRGAVTEGGSRLRLQGRWSEALHAGDPPAARCLWRPGAMPPEHEMYYGFTRFAMELNELEPGMKEVLPHTDTRLRPDQRALEEGDVETAETLKHQLEQAQRERRRDRPDPAPVWFRKTMEGGEETWVFTGEYWRARDAGFPHIPVPRLW